MGGHWPEDPQNYVLNRVPISPMRHQRKYALLSNVEHLAVLIKMNPENDPHPGFDCNQKKNVDDALHGLRAKVGIFGA